MAIKIKKNEEGKKVYELAFLLKDPSLDKVVIDFLNQYKAVIINQSPVNSLKLAYPIKKQTAAFFGVINFESDPASMKALSNALNLSNDVLRFLIIATPAVKKTTEKPETKRSGKVDSAPSGAVLSNKALEEKLEEILK